MRCLMDSAVIEIVGLFAAIGGQYIILFSLHDRVNRALIEMELCPYHNLRKRKGEERT